MLYGDGCLDRGVTRERALAAARAGIDDVEIAFGLGRSGRQVAGEALYAAVEEATGLPAGGRFPRLSTDNPEQNWEAADVVALWDSPMVGSTGTTVGQAVAAALEEGEELPTRLGCLGSGIAGDLDVPPVPGLRPWLNRRACEAYHRGFLDHLVSDPRGCIIEIVGATRRPAGERVR